MRHHREVVAIELKNLVIDQEPGLARCAVRGDLSNIDSVVSITLTLLILNVYFFAIVPEDFFGNPDLSHLQF